MTHVSDVYLHTRSPSGGPSVSDSRYFTCPRDHDLHHPLIIRAEDSASREEAGFADAYRLTRSNRQIAKYWQITWRMFGIQNTPCMCGRVEACGPVGSPHQSGQCHTDSGRLVISVKRV